MENNVKGRLNPIELFILAAVVSTFGFSVYQLVTPMKGTVVADATEGASRTIASVSSGELEVGCDTTQNFSTGSSQVRLAGVMCAKDMKARILNQANRFQAAVFADNQKVRYTTEYIPLNPGKNPIYFEFTNNEGKTLSQVITIDRN